MLRLAFDLDGVVCDIEKAMMKVAKEKYGVNIIQNEIRTFDFCKPTGLTKEQVEDIVTICIVNYKLPKPNRGAISFLKKYYQETGKQLLFITSRYNNKAATDGTSNWLHWWLRPTPWECSFCNGGTKSDRLIEKEVDIFIEDRVKNAEELADRERCVWLMDKPWNQHCREDQYIVRVYDWEEVEILWNAVKRVYRAEARGLE